MGFSLNSCHVEANLFTPSGKWKYEICLDYTDCDFENPDLWAEARKALKAATEKNISGVTIEDLKDYWIMVVLEPYSKYSYPIIVTGRDKDNDRGNIEASFGLDYVSSYYSRNPD